LSLTTSGKFTQKSLSGAHKAVFVDKKWGEFEGEVDSGSNKIYGKGTLTNLVKNAKFMIGGGFDPTCDDPLVKENWSVKGEAEFRQEFVAISGTVLVGEEDKNVASTVEVAGVIGFEGLSVGGQVKAKLDNKQSLSDYNIGAQWERKDFIGSLLSEKEGQVLRFAWVHKVSPTYNLGAEIVSDEFQKLCKDRKLVINLASEYQLDPDTSIKFRTNNYGEIGTVFEHRLAHPALTLSAAAQFRAHGTSRLQAEKFGLAVSLGA